MASRSILPQPFYMGKLKPGMRVEDIKVYTVFIGSCTNARL
jgi:homoaconitase/3-isopropylmalate dehydratase large subunit